MQHFLLFIAGCLQSPVSDTAAPQLATATPSPLVDHDGDRYTASEDCDDTDPTVHPGQPEICDGRDDNCNGLADEGYPDTDQDGMADCVDLEACDGLDNDGDGQIDEGYPDTDRDGAADCTDGESCDGLDNDGDGQIDEGFDLDGDGVPPCGAAPDCDDNNGGIYPGAEERVDDVDNDCDGLIDEDRYARGDLVLTELMVNPLATTDPDGEWLEITNVTDEVRYLNGLLLSTGDTQHTIAAAPALPIVPGEILVLSASAEALRNGNLPTVYAYSALSLSNEGGTLEIFADGLLIDAASWDVTSGGQSLTLDLLGWDAGANDDPMWWCPATVAWAPEEPAGDTGSPGAPNEFCPAFDHDGDGYTGADGDCDDAEDEIHPGAVEVWYDGIDQDCDGASDLDADGDGVGIDSGDCDDADPEVTPGRSERCDGVDNNCDGEVDEDAVDGTWWFVDMDRDGHGDDSDTTWACEAPGGYSMLSDDCDDSDDSISPSEAEVCGNGVDNDCDGAAQFCDEAPHSIGGDDWDWSARNHYRGNIYLAEDDEELLRFEMMLDLPSGGCDLSFMVFSADSLTGTWEPEWAETRAVDAGGWVSSPGIELEVAAGSYYSLGVGWSCKVTYYADYGTFDGEDGGVGGFAGNHYDNAFTSTTGYTPATVGSGSFAYAQVVYVAE